MTLKQELCSTAEGLRAWQQERTILAITELICGEMNDRGLSRETLASWICVSEASLSKMLNHETQLNVRMACNCLTVMGLQFTIGVEPISKD